LRIPYVQTRKRHDVVHVKRIDPDPVLLKLRS